VSGYEVKVEQFAVERAADLIVRSLKDRQQFADPDGAAERAGISSATWPLFGHVWPSGRILADHMGSIDIAGRRVIELGCGLGLASMVMHRGGADVTASDIHPLAEAFMRANVLLNGLLPLPFRCGDWTHADEALGRFGLLVGSDLLYERSHASDLSEFIDQHAHATADVIIVDPNRGQRAAFRKLMAVHRFTASVVVAPARVFGGITFRGQILSFHRDP